MVRRNGRDESDVDVNPPVPQVSAKGDHGDSLHGEAPGDGTGLVGEEVAEQVRGVVGVEVGERDIRVLPGADIGDHLPLQHARFHDVGLVDGEQAAPAPARELETNAGDALDFRLGVDGGVEGATPAAAKVLDAAGQAEVGAPAQLSQHHQVGAADPFRPKRRALDEGFEGPGRPQSGIDVEIPAKAHEPILVGGVPRHGARFGALFDRGVAVGKVVYERCTGYAFNVRLELAVRRPMFHM